MSSLSLFLPPFASDYSGAASALFDWDCLVAINDGSCCTSHFACYEEPRWKTGKRQTLCTNLRLNDAVFGIDQRVIQQLGEAARDLDAQRIVVLGTPVPAIIGTDMAGLAIELEEACGIPSYGIDTTGFSSYVEGIGQVFELVMGVINRSCKQDASTDAALHHRDIGASPCVSILGMTPLDYGVANQAPLVDYLRQQDLSIGAQLFMNMNETPLESLRTATANIAVSYAGLLAAHKLQRLYGTPYIACSFMGSAVASRAANALKEAKPLPAIEPMAENGKRVLVLGDQVIAHTLRQTVRLQADSSPAPHITVASFFGLDASLSEEGDAHLPTEAHLLKHLSANRYDLIVGDPLLQRIPAVQRTGFMPLVHPAVSSRLYWDDVPQIASFDFDALAAEILLL